MEDFAANARPPRDRPRQRPAGETEILIFAALIERTAAAAKGRPLPQVPADPDRNEQRGVLCAETVGRTGQKDTWKHRHVPTEALLMQDAKLRGEFDVADAARKRTAAGSFVFDRKNRGKLEIRRCAVVEINASDAALAVDCMIAGGQRVNFEM